MTNQEAFECGKQLAVKTAMSDLARTLAITGGGALGGAGAGALFSPEGERGHGALVGGALGGAGGLLGSHVSLLAKRLSEAKKLHAMEKVLEEGTLPKPGTPESAAMLMRMLGG